MKNFLKCKIMYEFLIRFWNEKVIINCTIEKLIYHYY